MINLIAQITKLLTSGGFFFAWSGKEGAGAVDLSRCTQKRLLAANEDADYRFFWCPPLADRTPEGKMHRRNRTLHLPLSRYGIKTSDWLLRITCGGVEVIL